MTPKSLPGKTAVPLVARRPAASRALAPALPDPRKNDLLAALADGEWARWLPHLESVEMPLGKVLYESGSRLSHVYFPTTSIISLLYVMEDGASAEIAVVGHEGIVGISLFMGGESTPSRAVVQSAGQGFRLKAALMMQEFNRAGPVLHLLLRYTQALITQMAQTAVCNRHHSLDQQLCRWLLLSLDRLASDELVMTQELIANMLGVRREGVTEAAASRCWTARGSNSAPASAMPWSRTSTGGCFPRSSRRSSRPGRILPHPRWPARSVGRPFPAVNGPLVRRFRDEIDMQVALRASPGVGPLQHSLGGRAGIAATAFQCGPSRLAEQFLNLLGRHSLLQLDRHLLDLGQG
jgi:CRP-like cAMP-binding protein